MSNVSEASVVAAVRRIKETARPEETRLWLPLAHAKDALADCGSNTRFASQIVEAIGSVIPTLSKKGKDPGELFEETLALQPIRGSTELESETFGVFCKSIQGLAEAHGDGSKVIVSLLRAMRFACYEDLLLGRPNVTLQTAFTRSVCGAADSLNQNYVATIGFCLLFPLGIRGLFDSPELSALVVASTARALPRLIDREREHSLAALLLVELSENARFPLAVFDNLAAVAPDRSTVVIAATRPADWRDHCSVVLAAATADGKRIFRAHQLDCERDEHEHWWRCREVTEAVSATFMADAIRVFENPQNLKELSAAITQRLVARGVLTGYQAAAEEAARAAGRVSEARSAYEAASQLPETDSVRRDAWKALQQAMTDLREASTKALEQGELESKGKLPKDWTY